MFIPHVAAASAARARPGQPRRSSGGPPRSVGLAIAAIALASALAPLFAAVFGDVHGDAVAAGVLIGLLSAGFGFGMARVIGRQR